MKIEGHVALITGAAKRIGRAIALELAQRGCDIAVHYHTSEAEAFETAELIRAGGRKAITIQASLSDADAAAALPKKTVDELGRLDILINNASIFEPMSLDDFSPARWNETLAVNLTAPMILSHAAYPYLSAEGQGRIVNLGDICAERPWPNHLAYCVSKAGLSSLTQALAKAMAPSVRVNAVAPGAALFPEDWSRDQIKAVTRRVPALRAGTPEEVAATVRFLVTDCDYITGAILAVDGGRNIAW
ncbi:MAG: SDR family oxidoreductase [Planctomycetota bacterium]